MIRRLATIFLAGALAACGGGAGEESAAGGPQADDAPVTGTPLPTDTMPGAVTGDPDRPVSSDGTVDPAAPAPARPGAGSPAGAGSPPSTGGAEAALSAGPDRNSTAAADGAALLQRAATSYERVRSLRAEFVMNFTNPLLRQTVTSRGTIYQRQPDRIALHFTEPSGDVIIGDGQYFWIYYPSNNAQQVIRSPAAAAGESGVNLQAQFVGNPVQRFEHTLEGTATVAGRQAHVLLLVPRQRAEYRSLRVWLDDRDALARRFEITEHNGSVRRFDLQDMQVNPSIPDEVFRFTPPAGARIVPAG